VYHASGVKDASRKSAEEEECNANLCIRAQANGIHKRCRIQKKANTNKIKTLHYYIVPISKNVTLTFAG
jgi:hypothetical protein